MGYRNTLDVYVKSSKLTIISRKLKTDYKSLDNGWVVKAFMHDKCLPLNCLVQTSLTINQDLVTIKWISSFLSSKGRKYMKLNLCPIYMMGCNVITFLDSQIYTTKNNKWITFLKKMMENFDTTFLVNNSYNTHLVQFLTPQSIS